MNPSQRTMHKDLPRPLKVGLGSIQVTVMAPAIISACAPRHSLHVGGFDPSPRNFKNEQMDNSPHAPTALRCQKKAGRASFFAGRLTFLAKWPCVAPQAPRDGPHARGRLGNKTPGTGPAIQRAARAKKRLAGRPASSHQKPAGCYAAISLFGVLVARLVVLGAFGVFG